LRRERNCAIRNPRPYGKILLPIMKIEVIGNGNLLLSKNKMAEKEVKK